MTTHHPFTGNQPRVWLVLGDKTGDNAQALTIAEALPWHCEHKHIQVRDEFVLGKPRVAPTLSHIVPERSDLLEPPWPDLIITVGRRPANVALWIRDQSQRHTRIVLVGKPSGMMDAFDLIVASAENQFPPLANVLPISLPLMRVDEAAVRDAAGIWAPRLTHLPRPLIAILVGGPTGPFIFNRRVTRRLLALARQIIEETGGTPYLSTSRRTPPQAVTALAEALPGQARLFAWMNQGDDNPYRGLLALADGFVVTGDSISMLTEIVRLRRPLAVFPLPTGVIGSLDQLRRALARLLFLPARGTRFDTLRQRLARTVYCAGLITHTRDFRAFHKMLIDQGLAVPAGAGFPAPSGQVPDDLAPVVERIKAVVKY